MTLRMQFNQPHQPDIDVNAPLIYLWEITDAAGQIVGRYVGKAEGGAKRPTRAYEANVNRLLEERPYRTKGRDYRRVHQALATAVRAEHSITLRYLCNVSPDEDIYAVEQHYIRAYGCLTSDIGLNAQREENASHSKVASAPNNTPVMKAETNMAESSQNNDYGLGAFHQLIRNYFPNLTAKQGVNRYSFFAPDNVRIIRGEQESPTSRVNVKLSLTSRLESCEQTFNWDGTDEQLLEAVKAELLVYERHFRKE